MWRDPKRSNPMSRRSVNKQEIEYLDEEHIENNHGNTEYDLDTSVETLVVMENETHNPNYGNGPIKVMMDRRTWSSLNDNTKKHWDCIKQAEKEKILNYARARSLTHMNSQNSVNRIGGFNLMNNNAKTTVNTHDMETVDREFIEDNNDKLEARVHQLEAQIDLVCNGNDTISMNLLRMTKSAVIMRNRLWRKMIMLLGHRQH